MEDGRLALGAPRADALEDRLPRALAINVALVEQLVSAHRGIDLECRRRATAGFRGELVDSAAAKKLRREPDHALPLTAVATMLGLTPLAVEQLVEEGLLELAEHPAFRLLYAEAYIAKYSVDALTSKLRKVGSPLQAGAGWVPLSIVMRGIGGRPKPWASVIREIVGGNLRIATTPDGALKDLHLPVRSAARLLRREAEQKLFEAPKRDGLTFLEASEFLNIGWRRLSALFDRGLLNADNGSRSRQLGSVQLADIGAKYISSHELAARRLKRRPISAHAELRRLGLRPVIGDLFWEREHVEQAYLL